MAENQGVMCDETGDLLIQNGSFVVGNTEAQETRRILLSAKGGYWWEPLLGVDLQMKLGQSLTRDGKVKLEGEIASQLRNDGFTVNSISLNAEGEMEVDAERV